MFSQRIYFMQLLQITGERGGKRGGWWMQKKQTPHWPANNRTLLILSPHRPMHTQAPRYDSVCVTWTHPITQTHTITHTYTAPSLQTPWLAGAAHHLLLLLTGFRPDPWVGPVPPHSGPWTATRRRGSGRLIITSGICDLSCRVPQKHDPSPLCGSSSKDRGDMRRRIRADTTPAILYDSPLSRFLISNEEKPDISSLSLSLSLSLHWLIASLSLLHTSTQLSLSLSLSSHHWQYRWCHPETCRDARIVLKPPRAAAAGFCRLGEAPWATSRKPSPHLAFSTVEEIRACAGYTGL